MGQDYIPAADLKFQAWATTFLTVATANKTALGLDTATLSNLDADQMSYGAGLTNHDNAVAAARSARENKVNVRKTFESDIRLVVRQIQGNPSMPTELILQLGLFPHNATHSHDAPATPLSLVAQGFDTGVNELKWKRNGNKGNTQFIVEARIGTDTDFIMVGTTTKTRFSHRGQTPGVKIVYRVYAQRDDMTSDFSNTANVYETVSNPLVLRKVA